MKRTVSATEDLKDIMKSLLLQWIMFQLEYLEELLSIQERESVLEPIMRVDRSNVPKTDLFERKKTMVDRTAKI